MLILQGHSDVVMGVLATSNEQLAEKIRFLQNGMSDIWKANIFNGLTMYVTCHVTFPALTRICVGFLLGGQAVAFQHAFPYISITLIRKF